MVTQQEFEEAKARGQEELRTLPRALNARYDEAVNLVVVELNTGYTVAFPPYRCQDLEHAKPEELVSVEISFPGFGLYFPAIDADLWVPGLARGVFGTPRWEAMWLATHPLEATPYPVSEAPQEELDQQESSQIEAA